MPPTSTRHSSSKNSTPEEEWPSDWPIQRERTTVEEDARLPIGPAAQAVSGSDIHVPRALTSSTPKALLLLPGQLSVPKTTTQLGTIEGLGSGANTVLRLGSSVQMTGKAVPTTNRFMVVSITSNKKVTVKAILSKVHVFGDVQRTEGPEGQKQQSVAPQQTIQHRRGAADRTCIGTGSRNRPVEDIGDDSDDSDGKQAAVAARKQPPRQTVAKKKQVDSTLLFSDSSQKSSGSSGVENSSEEEEFAPRKRRKLRTQSDIKDTTSYSKKLHVTPPPASNSMSDGDESVSLTFQVKLEPAKEQKRKRNDRESGYDDSSIEEVSAEPKDTKRKPRLRHKRKIADHRADNAKDPDMDGRCDSDADSKSQQADRTKQQDSAPIQLLDLSDESSFGDKERSSNLTMTTSHKNPEIDVDCSDTSSVIADPEATKRNTRQTRRNKRVNAALSRPEANGSLQKESKPKKSGLGAIFGKVKTSRQTQIKSREQWTSDDDSSKVTIATDEDASEMATQEDVKTSQQQPDLNSGSDSSATCSESEVLNVPKPRKRSKPNGHPKRGESEQATPKGIKKGNNKSFKKRPSPRRNASMKSNSVASKGNKKSLQTEEVDEGGNSSECSKGSTTQVGSDSSSSSAPPKDTVSNAGQQGNEKHDDHPEVESRKNTPRTKKSFKKRSSQSSRSISTENEIQSKEFQVSKKATAECASTNSRESTKLSAEQKGEKESKGPSRTSPKCSTTDAKPNATPSKLTNDRKKKPKRPSDTIDGHALDTTPPKIARSKDDSTPGSKKLKNPPSARRRRTPGSLRKRPWKPARDFSFSNK